MKNDPFFLGHLTHPATGRNTGPQRAPAQTSGEQLDDVLVVELMMSADSLPAELTGGTPQQGVLQL